MLFGERCSLCGGRLDSHRVCTECGLDNNKSEKHYHVNRSSCDGQPLTHVHGSRYYSGNTGGSPQTQARAAQSGGTAGQTEARRSVPGQAVEREGRRKKKERTYNTYIEEEKRRRKSRVGKAVVFVVVIILLVSVVPPILSQFLSGSGQEAPFFEDYDYDYTYEDYEYDPYAYVTRELSADGETYSEQLAQGNYIVGTHIPEGTYIVEGDGESFFSLTVEDKENSIYMYESVDEETVKVEDVRLYAGAEVSVSGEGYLRFSADNAQTGQMSSRPNPLTESVRIGAEETMTAGGDFPAGVYDVKAVSGYGSPDITIYDTDGTELTTVYLWISDSSDTENVYRNMILPQGAVIANMDEALELELIPSETIASEDYLSYYTYD